MFRLREAALYLGTTESAVRRMVRRRQIPYMILGHRYLIDRLALDRYIEQHTIGVVV